jgi:hypothetical protein
MDLAADERFNGKVIMDVAEQIFFSPIRYAQKKPHVMG